MRLIKAFRKSLRAVKESRHLNVFTASHPEQRLVPKISAAKTRISEGTAKSPIDGCLIAVKDNICTSDLPTTCASNMLRGYVSPYEATVVKRLQDAGAVVMGKTNMDEFGMGSHSIFSAYGAVQGPVSENGSATRSAGGSSGGSAMAVATRMAHAALGTDTGGSVRLPASYCGVVGFKPSYGMVSRWGVVAYANSLDTVGVLGRDVLSVKQVYDIINGYDSNDPTNITPKTRERVSDRLHKIRSAREGPLRIGVPLEYNLHELTPAVRQSWQEVLTQLTAQGHEVLPISLPTTRQALSAYYVIAPAEASSNLARYDGLRYGHRDEADRSEEEDILFAPTRQSGFGDEVRRRILLGAYTLSAGAMDNYFLKAQAVRRLVQRDFDAAFRVPNFLLSDIKEEGKVGAKVDAIIAPTALSIAPELEDVKSMQRAVDGYVNDVLTVPASLAGIPSISIPVKAKGHGSVGMQVMTQWGDEEGLWQVAQELCVSK